MESKRRLAPRPRENLPISAEVRKDKSPRKPSKRLVSFAAGILEEGRLGGVTVITFDLRSRGRGFNSRSGRYQVVTTWMGDTLWTSKPSRYITNHLGQLSLPSLWGM